MHYTRCEGILRRPLFSSIRCPDYSRLSWPQEELKHLEAPESGEGHPEGGTAGGEEKEIDQEPSN